MDTHKFTHTRTQTQTDTGGKKERERDGCGHLKHKIDHKFTERRIISTGGCLLPLLSPLEMRGIHALFAPLSLLTYDGEMKMMVMMMLMMTMTMGMDVDDDWMSGAVIL